MDERDTSNCPERVTDNCRLARRYDTHKLTDELYRYTDNDENRKDPLQIHDYTPDERGRRSGRDMARSMVANSMVRGIRCKHE